MTCLIAPYSYWFKPQVIHVTDAMLKDILPKDEYGALFKGIALDTAAYQDLEAKLDRLKRHRIK